MNGVFIRGFFLKILSIGWVTIKDRLATRDRIAEWVTQETANAFFVGASKKAETMFSLNVPSPKGFGSLS